MALKAEQASPSVSENRPHVHSGWFCCPANKVIMVRRIDKDRCTTIYAYNKAWCVTHNTPENWGHASDMAQKGLRG